jgi:hypothetical protein
VLPALLPTLIAARDGLRGDPPPGAASTR